MPIVSGLDIWRLVDGALDSTMSPTRRKHRLIVCDSQYRTVGVGTLRGAIKTDPVLSPAMYVPETFDCDDYCIYLKAKLSLVARNQSSQTPYAIGFLLTGKHAFNLCVNDQYQVVLLNTQSTDLEYTSNEKEFATFLDTNSTNLVNVVVM